MCAGRPIGEFTPIDGGMWELAHLLAGVKVELPFCDGSNFVRINHAIGKHDLGDGFYKEINETVSFGCPTIQVKPRHKVIVRLMGDCHQF